MCDLRQITSFVEASVSSSIKKNNSIIIFHKAIVRLNKQVHVKCLDVVRHDISSILIDVLFRANNPDFSRDLIIWVKAISIMLGTE